MLEKGGHSGGRIPKNREPLWAHLCSGLYPIPICRFPASFYGNWREGENQVVKNFFSDLLEGLYLDEDTLEELEQMLKEKRGRGK